MNKSSYRIELISYMRIYLKKPNCIKISMRYFKLIFSALKKTSKSFPCVDCLLNDFFEKFLRGVRGDIIFKLNKSFFCKIYFLSWM